MNFEKKGYKLVWNDEFDSDKLDSSKWTLRADMSGRSDLALCGEENPKVMRLEDGMLKLNVVENATDANNRSYSTCYSVTTFNKMRFRYGYLEISARVPYMQGAWPSFWLKSLEDDICPPKKGNYMAEIDIFEVFSNINTAVPNLHKWYPYNVTLESGYETNHTQGGDMLDKSQKKQPYVFKDITNLNDEYHTYGFEWTPEYMEMSVDGEVYCTYDINSNFDGHSDMSGFHDALYVLFNNHIFTENSEWLPKGTPQVDERTDFPIHYWIDYIRLYQKDEYGDLYLA
jgi:beta-glucanase (GH16 family)